MQANLFMFHFSFMKKTLYTLTLFFFVLFLLDWGFGITMHVIESKSEDKNYHCRYEANEDILVLGSSYAARDIVPSVIESELGLTCYNAGEPGNGVIAAWARYNMFINKHTPKLIIYTLTPLFDYFEDSDYSKYLAAIRPYYGIEPIVNDIYEELGTCSDRYKLQSSFVRYNSKWLQTLAHVLTHKNQGLNGYEPLYQVYTPDDNNLSRNTDLFGSVDYKKLKYVEALFSDIVKKDICIVCLITPHYYKENNLAEYQLGLNLCKKYNIPVLNSMYHDSISGKKELFPESE